MPFENTNGKVEISRNKVEFLLLPQSYLPILEEFNLKKKIKLSSANSFSLEKSKICRLERVKDTVLLVFNPFRLYSTITRVPTCQILALTAAFLFQLILYSIDTHFVVSTTDSF